MDRAFKLGVETHDLFPDDTINSLRADQSITAEKSLNPEKKKSTDHVPVQMARGQLDEELRELHHADNEGIYVTYNDCSRPTSKKGW